MSPTKNRLGIILLTLSYLGFIIANIIALGFDLHLGLKANMIISLIADISFLWYLWHQ